MIRATCEAQAFDGKVDAYKLPDGTIVLSSRGAVSGLTAGGRKHASIEAYASGMLAENAERSLPLVEFETPRGVRSKGVTLDVFVRIVSWWAEAFFSGSLRSDQEHIGVNCARLQSAAARLGWEALARSWFGESLPAEVVAPAMAKYLLDTQAAYASLYSWELPEALAPLIYGSRVTLSHDQWPKWMLGIHQFLNDVQLGKEIATEARARRENRTDPLHPGFTPELRTAIRAHIPTLIGLARSSYSLEHWKEQIRIMFGVGGGVQMPLDPEMLKRPDDPEAA